MKKQKWKYVRLLLGRHHEGPTASARAQRALADLLWHGGQHDEVNREFLDTVQANREVILQVCLNFTDRQPDNLRDMYQDIVAKLWKSWREYRGECSAESWVRRIAINTAVSELRRKASEPCLLPLDEWLYDSMADEPDATADEDRDYYRRITELDPVDRALVYMRLERMSIKEIAEETGFTEAAVKQRLYRMRQKQDKTRKR